MDRATIAALIEKHRDRINLATPGNPANSTPSEERIYLAEKLIGLKLPEDYKWFLRQYVGGEIGGYEIFSLYPTIDIPGGDLNFQYKLARENGSAQEHEIPLIFNYDYGEFFFFDASAGDGSEYPVILKLGHDPQPYAANFLEFLEKIIKLNCG